MKHTLYWLILKKNIWTIPLTEKTQDWIILLLLCIARVCRNSDGKAKRNEYIHSLFRQTLFCPCQIKGSEYKFYCKKI